MSRTSPNTPRVAELDPECRNTDSAARRRQANSAPTLLPSASGHGAKVSHLPRLIDERGGATVEHRGDLALLALVRTLARRAAREVFAAAARQQADTP